VQLLALSVNIVDLSLGLNIPNSLIGRPDEVIE
jgi:hypothetical protein